MGLLLGVCIGLALGILDGKAIHGEGPSGLAIALLVGAAGASVGGLVVGLLTDIWVWGYNPWSLLAAPTGAVGLLALYRYVARIDAQASSGEE